MLVPTKQISNEISTLGGKSFRLGYLNRTGYKDDARATHASLLIGQNLLSVIISFGLLTGLDCLAALINCFAMPLLLKSESPINSIQVPEKTPKSTYICQKKKKGNTPQESCM